MLISHLIQIPIKIALPVHILPILSLHGWILQDPLHRTTGMILKLRGGKGTKSHHLHHLLIICVWIRNVLLFLAWSLSLLTRLSLFVLSYLLALFLYLFWFYLFLCINFILYFWLYFFLLIGHSYLALIKFYFII